MKQSLLMEKYPVFEMELGKNETTLQGVDAIIAHFKAKIDANPLVAYIGTFDHLAHTRSLPGSEVAPNILAAKLIVFCFGVKLPNPHVMALRPRSIGVADLGDKFVVNFMEPPMPVATQAMEAWAKELRNA